MLFVLYGGTLELGFISREFFSNQGFEIVKKYNYVTDESKMDREKYKSPISVYKDWFNDKIFVEKKDIEKLDFQYEQSGIMLGFDKRQILPSVQGIQDSIITLSASSIDFVRQLKKPMETM